MKNKIILLAGSGKKNLPWIESVKNSFLKNFNDVTAIYYDNWNDEEKKDLNIELESKKLIENASNNDEYIIFAKSAGIFVTLKTINEFDLKPKFCLFLGFPKDWLEERNIEYLNYLKSIKIDTLIIQNDNDPMCSYEDLQKLIINNKIENIKIIKTIGDTHNYEDLDLYIKIIKDNVL